MNWVGCEFVRQTLAWHELTPVELANIVRHELHASAGEISFQLIFTCLSGRIHSTCGIRQQNHSFDVRRRPKS
jgi:hypothetical protein